MLLWRNNSRSQIIQCMGQASETQSRALRDKKIHFPHKERIEQRGNSMKHTGQGHFCMEGMK